MAGTTTELWVAKVDDRTALRIPRTCRVCRVERVNIEVVDPVRAKAEVGCCALAKSDCDHAALVEASPIKVVAEERNAISYCEVEEASQISGLNLKI
jgi:hypothetical protein